MTIKRKVTRGFLGGAFAIAAVAATASTAFAAGTPTCGGLDLHGDGNVLAVHGHHVVRDYVTGEATMTWPPSGQVDASGGAAEPGGPSHHFLREDGIFVAPGASFCVSQAKSPGFPHDE